MFLSIYISLNKEKKILKNNYVCSSGSAGVNGLSGAPGMSSI